MIAMGFHSESHSKKTGGNEDAMIDAIAGDGTVCHVACDLYFFINQTEYHLLSSGTSNAELILLYRLAYHPYGVEIVIPIR